jgi:hypothetical protein
VKPLDPDDPDYAEMLRRFEYAMDVEKSRDTDDLFRKFRYFINREPSVKQRILLERFGRKKGIPIGIRHRRGIGISERKGIRREVLTLHFTVHKVRGKARVVARILKGQKGAGRFAKFRYS